MFSHSLLITPAHIQAVQLGQELDQCSLPLLDPHFEAIACALEEGGIQGPPYRWPQNHKLRFNNSIAMLSEVHRELNELWPKLRWRLPVLFDLLARALCDAGDNAQATRIAAAGRELIDERDHLSAVTISVKANETPFAVFAGRMQDALRVPLLSTTTYSSATHSLWTTYGTVFGGGLGALGAAVVSAHGRLATNHTDAELELDDLARDLLYLRFCIPNALARCLGTLGRAHFMLGEPLLALQVADEAYQLCPNAAFNSLVNGLISRTYE